MVLQTWVGSDGDWNDPTNWDTGTVPLTTDAAIFQPGTSDTLEGSAYVGAVELAGASVDVSGYFSSDGVTPASFSDNSAQSSGATLSIDPWATLQLDSLQLGETTLDDTGLLVTRSATVSGGSVNGEGAAWFSTDALVQGTVSALNGGSLQGNYTLGDEAALVVDQLSTVAGGTLSVEKNASIQFANTPATNPSPLVFSDDIALADGAILNFTYLTSAPIEIHGQVSGSGTLMLAGADIRITGAGSFSTDALVLHSGVQLPNDTNYELDSSSLDLSTQTTGGASGADIVCASGSDTVIGGALPFAVSSTGADLMSVVGGSGSNTVSAGQSTLDYWQGSGNATVTCGTSGHDTVRVGQSSSSVQAATGAQIVVSGRGATSVRGGSGSYLIDDSAGAGNALFFGNTGEGVTSVLGGAGAVTVQGMGAPLSVTGGSGSLLVWGGECPDDTIIGGSGPATLVGGAGSTIIANGSKPCLLGVSLSNATVDASNSSGADTLFAGSGSGITRLIGGSGGNVFLGGSTTADIQCGSGGDIVWANSDIGDTITGGTGNDTIQASQAASISLSGPGDNTVISYGESTVIDARASTGPVTLFAQGQGQTDYLGGTGSLTCILSTAGLHLQTGSAATTLFAGGNASATITGAGAAILVLAGHGDTIDASGSTGSLDFFNGKMTDSTITFGSGNDIFVGGAGGATINAGAGSGQIWVGDSTVDINVFANESQAGSLAIVGFDTVMDTFTFASSLPVSSEQTSAGLQLTSGMETVTLYGYFGTLPTHE